MLQWLFDAWRSENVEIKAGADAAASVMLPMLRTLRSVAHVHSSTS